MPADSGFQDSVEKGREALRRSMADGSESVIPARRAEARASSDLHPFFRGLLETLPELGADWSAPEREKWLETARNIFALLYREPARDREPVEFRARDQAPPYPTSERRIA